MAKLKIIILTHFSFQRLFLFQLHLPVSILQETFCITGRRKTVLEIVN